MNYFAKHKQLITNLLLAFVLISIGFALGKHSATTRSAVSQPGTAVSNVTTTTGNSMLKLYYMHATFRCVTCNSIESKAKELVQRDFADALKRGKIAWEDVNFQENETLSRKFDVVASCVVLAQVVNGEIMKFQRLDEVWTLLDKPVEFERYVLAAVKKAYDEVNGAGQ